ncbi:cytochrome c556 [Novosphingobium sp. PhB165]|uniref:cytochrome c n=1 Tax=Novosphingobium sp. PhB165 TaxID=2485105 RepID=UPI0010461B6F|nr:cytochrome c [Novosphingobium sp. PhB165]TCM19665.1 cytochrome c556 [Novosphingobium sp. PhB165]
MASKFILTTTIAAAALAAVAGCKGPQAAPDSTATATNSPIDVSTIVKTRKANFKDIAKSNKVAKVALEASTPDFPTASAAAQAIQTDAGKIVGLFPDGTGPAEAPKTEALPIIWQKNAEFKAAADKLIAAAGTLKTAADAKDLAAANTAMAGIGAACKGCHETFRKKDK